MRLNDQDPLEILANTPANLERILKTLGVAGAELSYAPGKWVAREIVCHLADMEIVFGFRLRQAFDTEHVLQPVNEESWAKSYLRLPIQSALIAFLSARTWNLALIETFEKSDFDRTMRHPKHGVQNVMKMLKIFAGHDLNHLEQLEKITKS